jgi:hypothetical protein
MMMDVPGFRLPDEPYSPLLYLNHDLKNTIAFISHHLICIASSNLCELATLFFVGDNLL